MAEDEHDQTSLHKAAIDNDLPRIKSLSSLGVDFNEKDKKGLTPLHCAAKKNSRGSHYAVIEELLKNRANVNARDDSGKTPLHYLSTNADIETVELLLDNGANVNSEDEEGETPLFDAATYHNTEIVQLLVDRGSDINHVSSGLAQFTALHAAVTSLSCEDLDTIKCLLKNGAKLDALDEQGYPVFLHFFQFNGYATEELVTFFLKYSDVNYMGSDDIITIMNYYLDRNHLEIILQHVAKLQALGIDIKWLLATISFDDLDHYFKDCTNELTLAKNTKLKNSWVTYFDLLVASKKKLKNYAGNKDLIKDFKNAHWLKKFPIYKKQIFNNMIKGIDRRRLFDRTSISICNYLPIFNPNHLVVRDILDYTTTKDLSKLCK